MASKKTLVIGASTNSSRYSYMAVHRLLQKGHEVIPMGVKKGEVGGLKIINDQVELNDVDTVTLYIGPHIQQGYYNYLLNLKPNRVIFNPGTINREFMDELEKSGVEVVDACTLVMLSAGTY